ncbi:MAG: YbaB/EbfC family nucleoid-associated protein [Gammaproteobacteria bacterium]|nr:YbaB/EbfC family nucleoid-associated protein [Gammaproteobacteria bacterium]
MKAAIGQLMRQAQEVQERIKRLQAELAAAEITGSAGAGLVKVTLNGRHEAKRVEIAAAALDEDKAFLEDLIAAAINDASQRLETMSKEKMSQATGGLSLPPGINLGL